MTDGHAMTKLFRPVFAILLVALAPSWLAGGTGGGGGGERWCGATCVCSGGVCDVNGYEDDEFVTDFTSSSCDDARDECEAWADPGEN